MVETVRRLPMEAGVWWGIAGFLPTPRSRRNERVRPCLADLLPVADRIAELTAPTNPAWRPWWTDLEAHTEAAHVRRAIEGVWPAETDCDSGELSLVCRPNLDVHSGLAGVHRTRHGNLRADGVEVVLERALAHGRRTDDELWFELDPLPTPAELAPRHGDPAGLRVHRSATSVRYLWLDAAKRPGIPDRL
jgi:hypothetical protein